MALVDSLGFDLDQIGDPHIIRRPHVILRILGNLILILFFSSIIFATINFPAYLLIYRYRVNPSSIIQGVPPPEVPVQQLGENTLIIPKIGVNAPINWDTGSNDIVQVLSNKLAHLQGSGKPGENKNIFITGHSSNYWWNKGSLNTVFALLPQLNEKDEIIITYNGKTYRYQVSVKKEVSVKEAGDYFFSDSAQLTLMTCVPVGTNLRRLLIIAKPE